MKQRSLNVPYRVISTFAFLLLALPAAKSDGCGPQVSIGDDPTVGKACGTADGVTCGSDEYCASDSCGGEGVCTAFSPDGACDASYAPVCGCDGNTYSNSCVAHNSGINIAAQGECNSGGECGGIAGIECGLGEYCKYPDGTCSMPDSAGTCTALPGDGCYEIWAPVCGCDGVTYGNDCEAAVAGVSIASEGECQPAGETCGGFAGTMCDSGQLCDFADDSCGGADQTGVCIPLPQACEDIFAPVCGCDGLDYSNACEAHTAGTDVASDGACTSN